MKFLNFLRDLVLILMVILIIAIVIILVPYTIKDSKTGGEKTCIDIHEVKELNYSACYDALTKNIFVEVRNNGLLEKPSGIKISFFDYSAKSFQVEVPPYNSSVFKKLSAERNPFAIEVYFIDHEKMYCNSSLNLNVLYCSFEENAEGNSSLNLISEVSKNKFTNASYGVSSGGDSLPLDLVEADKIWENVCKSDWDCGPWTGCIDGYQKRKCVDKNNCTIPTGVPQRVKLCEVTCIEDWQCEWSDCINGYTTPTCVDNNNCGTNINKPQKISCKSTGCTPNFVCGEWSTCFADYNFLTLLNGNYYLDGVQSRICFDENGCEKNIKEVRECILAIDIYTKTFEKCGKEYIGIYNRLDNSLLANIEKNEQKEILNIDLTGDAAEVYCDHCFDGILNGDEVEIDCDGSCPSCTERIVYSDYSKNIFEKFFDRIFSLFD